MTKKDKLAKCKELLKSELTKEDKNWLHNEVFKHHEDIKEKIGVGISDIIIKKAGRWDNNCFHYLRKDNSIIDISYIQSLTPASAKGRVKKVLRNIIYPQIKEFRIKNNIPKNMEIDHFDLEFKLIVKNFMLDKNYQELNKKIIKINEYEDSFNDIKLINDFYKYHKKHAKLQPLTKEEHKKKTYNKFSLRPYQQEASDKGYSILKRHKVLILNFEVRTGKTHIALNISKNYKNVLFVTKKKAISSIEDDYATAGHDFNITIINYESLHKVKGSFDLVIADESHSLGSYPKPSKRTKALKELVSNDLILMTGTLLPESNAQIFHQLWITPFSPFRKFTNFYKFFANNGIPEIVYTSYGQAKSYKNVPYKNIEGAINEIKLSYTQKDAGFTSKINETILEVKMKPITYSLIERLKKDLVIEGADEVILADTGVKLMQKVHQLSSGTCKFESGNNKVIDYSKAEYIKENFSGQKLAIFYKFKAELDAIKNCLDVTQDLEEFNTTDKHIALQIVSGREGVNLSKADSLIYYNIDFSAVSYWQSRDRLTTMDRLENNVFWLFSKGGIEYKIYKSVMNKKDYTLNTFKKEL